MKRKVNGLFKDGIPINEYDAQKEVELIVSLNLLNPEIMESINNNEIAKEAYNDYIKKGLWPNINILGGVIVKLAEENRELKEKLKEYDEVKDVRK